jgi:hypothetical protein
MVDLVGRQKSKVIQQRYAPAADFASRAVHEPLRLSIAPKGCRPQPSEEGKMSGTADMSKLLVGTWRIASFSVMSLETNEVSRPFGEKPIGYLQYSPGGHIVVFLSADEMPK